MVAFGQKNLKQKTIPELKMLPVNEIEMPSPSKSEILPIPKNDNLQSNQIQIGTRDG